MSRWHDDDRIIDVQPKVICFCWEKQVSVALTMEGLIHQVLWACEIEHPTQTLFFSLNRWTPQPGWGHCCLPPKMVNTSAPLCMCITHVFSPIRILIPYMEIVNTCVAAKLELSPPPVDRSEEKPLIPHVGYRVLNLVVGLYDGTGFEEKAVVLVSLSQSTMRIASWSCKP